MSLELARRLPHETVGWYTETSASLQLLPRVIGTTTVLESMQDKFSRNKRILCCGEEIYYHDLMP